MAKDTKEETSLSDKCFPSACHKHILSKRAMEVTYNMEEHCYVIWSPNNRDVAASLAGRIPALWTGLVRCTLSFFHVLCPSDE